MEYSEAGGKLIHEKNQNKKNLVKHCPFKPEHNQLSYAAPYLAIWHPSELAVLCILHLSELRCTLWA